MCVNILINQFFGDCHQSLQPLINRYNCASIKGLYQHKNHRLIIKPYSDEQTANYPFYALFRLEFAHAPITLDIHYGDYNYSIETFLAYDYYHRFSLETCLKALKLNHKDIQRPQHSTAHSIHDTVKHIADTLHANNILLSSLSNRDLKTIQAEQDKTIKHIIRKRYTTQMQTACERAIKAYQKDDYKRAIILFRPYLQDLDPRYKDIYSLAIEKLGE